MSADGKGAAGLITAWLGMKLQVVESAIGKREINIASHDKVFLGRNLRAILVTEGDKPQC